MAYLVELTLRAERDLDYLYQRISAEDSAQAARWFNGLEDAIYTLERLPRRCPAAPESKKAKRQLRLCSMARNATCIGSFSKSTNRVRRSGS
ncbi:MAG: type II toxin-antitoxin system RelE/ParE family toxin [Candidatus Binataceae bacterium]